MHIIPCYTWSCWSKQINWEICFMCKDCCWNVCIALCVGHCCVCEFTRFQDALWMESNIVIMRFNPCNNNFILNVDISMASEINELLFCVFFCVISVAINSELNYIIKICLPTYLKFNDRQEGTRYILSITLHTLNGPNLINYCVFTVSHFKYD